MQENMPRMRRENYMHIKLRHFISAHVRSINGFGDCMQAVYNMLYMACIGICGKQIVQKRFNPAKPNFGMRMKITTEVPSKKIWNSPINYLTKIELRKVNKLSFALLKLLQVKPENLELPMLWSCIIKDILTSAGYRVEYPDIPEAEVEADVNLRLKIGTTGMQYIASTTPEEPAAVHSWGECQ